MDTKFEPLFTPWKIGNCEIKNRIVLCPMGGTSIFGTMKPSTFDKVAADHLLNIAKHECGLVIPGIATVKDAMGGKWLYQRKGKFKKLKAYMNEFHKTGAKLFIQLTAGMGRSFAITDAMTILVKNKFLGTLAKPLVNASYLCAAPSELPSRWSDEITCRPLTVKEIHEIVEAFAKTAKLCKDAGVDGIEVHAVHEGYLLDQFTLPYTNHRTDEYGGSFENRYRFPVEVVKAIKAACGQDFPVSLRYSVVSKTKGFREGALPGETDYKEVGRDMEESERAAKYLQDAGYDMLNCDNGTYDAWYWSHPPMYMPENCNLEDVSHIKKFVDVPVVCAGRMAPDVGAKAIKEGRIDGMGVARQFLADPEWVTKLREDRLDEIRPCICCHNACFTMSHYKGVANAQDMGDILHMARCAINPETMQGHKFDIIPAKKIKNVAVIGGGIGGMEAARIAALRGHKVTLYEKSDKLGGVFIPAAAFDFKEKDRDLIEWFRKQVRENKNITVKYNTEVKNLDDLKADEIIVATGAKERRLRMPGSENFLSAVDYLNGKEVGNDVVIIGGGLTGCEIAYDLYNHGKTPHIIEMKNDLIAVKGISLANTSFLRDFFKTNKVDVRLETTLSGVCEGGIKVKSLTEENATEQVIKCDNVIVSIGYTPAPLGKESKHVHFVGDCNKVGNLRTVIWKAWEIAEKL